MEQTAEEIVATSDDRAVRMTFDERNLGWFRVMLMGLIAFEVIMLFLRLSRGQWPRVLYTLADLAATFTILMSLGKQAPFGRFLRHHLTAVIIATMALESIFGFTVAPHNMDNTIPLTSVFPWFMTGFRMAAVELTLLHGSLAAIAFINALMLPKERAPMCAAAIFMNALPLAFNLFASRRKRRAFLGVWRDRRAQAGEIVRMRDELHYAREIQLSMLPEAPPQLDWVDVAGISIPASEVGGDYYDYFVVGDRLAIVSGDVAGHGLASGIVLATLRSGFTLLRDSLTDPARVLRQLHDLVAKTSRRRTLVTCAVVLLDREKKSATISSAGHPPVIVRRNGAAEAVELFAPPLGVRLNFEVPRREIPLERGDVFVLHTDGIYEATNANGDSYGLDRIVSLVSHAGGIASASQLRDAIVSDVERFRGSEKQRDDVTLVVATIRAC